MQVRGGAIRTSVLVILPAEYHNCCDFMCVIGRNPAFRSGLQPGEQLVGATFRLRRRGRSPSGNGLQTTRMSRSPTFGGFRV